MKTKEKYRIRLPWLTAGLKESIKHKIKLYRTSIKYHTFYNNTSYREYREKSFEIEEKMLSIFGSSK